MAYEGRVGNSGWDDTLRSVAADVATVRATLTPPDAILVGPRSLRSESERFAEGARGDMTWFNVCLRMFVPQYLERDNASGD